MLIGVPRAAAPPSPHSEECARHDQVEWHDEFGGYHRGVACVVPGSRSDMLASLAVVETYDHPVSGRGFLCWIFRTEGAAPDLMRGTLNQWGRFVEAIRTARLPPVTTSIGFAEPVDPTQRKDG